MVLNPCAFTIPNFADERPETQRVMQWLPTVSRSSTTPPQSESEDEVTSTVPMLGHPAYHDAPFSSQRVPVIQEMQTPLRPQPFYPARFQEYRPEYHLAPAQDCYSAISALQGQHPHGQEYQPQPQQPTAAMHTLTCLSPDPLPDMGARPSSPMQAEWHCDKKNNSSSPEKITNSDDESQSNGFDPVSPGLQVRIQVLRQRVRQGSRRWN